MDQSPSANNSQLSTQDVEAEADAVLRQEEEELDALVSLMEEANQSPNSPHYGSDEDDYDSLLMDYIISEKDNQEPAQCSLTEEQKRDDMDTSNG